MSKISHSPHYERKFITLIENVLPFITEEKTVKIYSGHVVNMGSQRYQTFKKSGTKCVKCGLEGKFFALEKATLQKTNKYHFNLYGIDKDGNEVMITKDHIIPKCKEGKDYIDNYQTMCLKCNELKKDNYE